MPVICSFYGLLIKMYWNDHAPPVVRLALSGEMRFRVEFADGIAGEVRFTPSHLTGVFADLKDPELFARARVEHGTVTWPGDLDLAPDAMYQAVKSHGVWILQ